MQSSEQSQAGQTDFKEAVLSGTSKGAGSLRCCAGSAGCRRSSWSQAFPGRRGYCPGWTEKAGTYIKYVRFGTKGEFGELAKLFEEGIANSCVQSLSKSEGQRKDNQEGKEKSSIQK